MLATQQNSKVQDGSLVANCVVVLKQYICNTVQGKKCGPPSLPLSLALAAAAASPPNWPPS
jgi:hypothetical protein